MILRCGNGARTRHRTTGSSSFRCRFATPVLAFRALPAGTRETHLVSEDQSYYVYILFDWLGIPRYVGKGKGKRDQSHETATDPINILKNEFVEQTWTMLEEIPKIRIRENLTEQEAFYMEIVFIKALGRIDLGTGPLTNMTDGGEGCINAARIGGKVTASRMTAVERRERASRMGKIGGKLGGSANTPKQLEARMRVIKLASDARRGSTNTPEHRQNISNARRGQPSSNRGKLSPLRGRPSGRRMSPEHNAKMMIALKRAITGVSQSPEHRRKISEARKAWWKAQKNG